MKSKSTISKKLFAFLIFCFLNISISFAQTFPLANTSCTSKDLEVVLAKLTGGDLCNSCPTATTLTRTLTLGINNTTGSTRGAFAFWGTIEVYSGTTSALISSTTRTGCAGPLAPNSITSLDFGTITYTCGDIIKIINIWMAWTTPGGTCPINPLDISPKCGQIPSITVNGGVNGEFALIDSQCGSDSGAIDLTPTGGTAPYVYLWTASAGGIIPEGQSINQDLTELVPGTYSVRIIDANGCVTYKTRTIIATLPPIAVFANTNNINVACGALTTSFLNYTNSGTAACLISGSVSSTLSSQTPVDVCGGTVTESWTLMDAYGREITTTRVISVSPAALPIMTAPEDITVACGGLPLPSTISFSNELNGTCLINEISNPSTFSTAPNSCGGNVTETWTAIDTCGRTLDSVSRTITVSPTALPIMTAPEDITVACADDVPAMISLTAIDNCCGSITVEGVDATTQGNCDNSFSIVRTWTFFDVCGNSSSAAQTINVFDDIAPVAPEAPASITVACADDVPAMTSLTAIDNCNGSITVEGVDANTTER